jgi:hypothetical protein
VNDNQSTATPLRPGTTGIADTDEVLMNAAACRERAIADLKQASDLPITRTRRLLESSAATWAARGALLECIAAGFNGPRTDKK